MASCSLPLVLWKLQLSNNLNSKRVSHANYRFASVHAYACACIDSIVEYCKKSAGNSPLQNMPLVSCIWSSWFSCYLEFKGRSKLITISALKSEKSSNISCIPLAQETITATSLSSYLLTRTVCSLFQVLTNSIHLHPTLPWFCRWIWRGTSSSVVAFIQHVIPRQPHCDN